MISYIQPTFEEVIAGSVIMIMMFTTGTILLKLSEYPGKKPSKE